MFAPRMAKLQGRAPDATSSLARMQPSLTASRTSLSQASPRFLPRVVQPKLIVGAANDPLEREADRVAEQVMRAPDPALSVTSAPPQISRKCADCDEEDAMAQPKRLGPSNGGLGEAPTIVDEVLRSPGAPLEPSSRAFFESRFGYDFSRVRVHADAQSARSAQSIGALAYTAANHIFFGPGLAPQSDRRLLAHELAHVVQQGGAPPSKANGGTARPAAIVSGSIGPQVQRQADKRLKDVSMPAFPCDRGGGIVLCNMTLDSMNAPNAAECFETGTRIIDACKGKPESCLAQAKCAACECLGEEYCRCTGIV